MCIRFVCRKLSVAVAICVLLSACNHEESSTEPNQAGDTINNTTNNNYFLSPTAVSTVFPAEVRVGERFFITGQNFGANDGSATLALSVNGVAVTNIESWTDTQIIATMPSGAGTGNVAVSVDGVAGAPGFVVVPWVADNPTNVKLSNSTAGAADNPAILNDGFGGTIIVWEEHKSATGSKDILAQRLDSSGAEMWTANGVVVSSATYDQQKPKLVADGVGGAIIVWEDYRNTDTNGTTMDLYAQRINSTGVVQWVTDGVVISTASGHQSNAEIVSDGASGAIIVWQDERVANI
ncbi:MAG: IPT/TIG domain-containing protein, partial [Gammaproteobacteria bacterium]|nr:IPT/TIG domain-containing protein [Gammaproteobacteria bacterium]